MSRAILQFALALGVVSAIQNDAAHSHMAKLQTPRVLLAGSLVNVASELGDLGEAGMESLDDASDTAVTFESVLKGSVNFACSKKEDDEVFCDMMGAALGKYKASQVTNSDMEFALYLGILQTHYCGVEHEERRCKIISGLITGMPDQTDETKFYMRYQRGLIDFTTSFCGRNSGIACAVINTLPTEFSKFALQKCMSEFTEMLQGLKEVHCDKSSEMCETMSGLIAAIPKLGGNIGCKPYAKKLTKHFIEMAEEDEKDKEFFAMCNGQGRWSKYSRPAGGGQDTPSATGSQGTASGGGGQENPKERLFGDGRFRTALTDVVDKYCNDGESDFCGTAKKLKKQYNAAVSGKQTLSDFRQHLQKVITESCNTAEHKEQDRCRALNLLQMASKVSSLPKPTAGVISRQKGKKGAQPGGAPPGGHLFGDGRFGKALKHVVKHYCEKKHDFCDTAQELQKGYYAVKAGTQTISKFLESLDGHIKEDCNSPNDAEKESCEALALLKKATQKAPGAKMATRHLFGDGRFGKGLASLVKHFCETKVHDFCATAQALQTAYNAVKSGEKTMPAFLESLDKYIKDDCSTPENADKETCGALALLKKSSQMAGASPAVAGTPRNPALSNGAKRGPAAGDNRFRKALKHIRQHYCKKESVFCATAMVLEKEYEAVTTGDSTLDKFMNILKKSQKEDCATPKEQSKDRCKALSLLKKKFDAFHR